MAPDVNRHDVNCCKLMLRKHPCTKGHYLDLQQHYQPAEGMLPVQHGCVIEGVHCLWGVADFPYIMRGKANKVRGVT